MLFLYFQYEGYEEEVKKKYKVTNELEYRSTKSAESPKHLLNEKIDGREEIYQKLAKLKSLHSKNLHIF
jgi:hypothetical protein